MGSRNRYRDELELLKSNDNYRSLPTDGYNCILNLSSNDYLGLSQNEHLYAQFMEEVLKKTYKLGSCSARLLNGGSQVHNELENLIASRYNARTCLLFNSGYHANIGILPALASKKDLIVADKLVHASIIDGAKLSSASFVRYKHLDYAHLEKLLAKNRKLYENVFIVSESIFSMDGDVADLKKLVELKQKYNCSLYIDEAHAIGVRGKNGLGCAEEHDSIQDIDFIIGTFGKALASTGAFVICDKLFKDYLINHSRSFIYTTALPPVNIAWTKFIFERLPEFGTQRENLGMLGIEFAKMLKQQAHSHIVPYIVGENKKAIEKAEQLEQKGVKVLPIRYPTVAKGTARLRFSLNAGMKINQLKLIENILAKNEN